MFLMAPGPAAGALMDGTFTTIADDSGPIGSLDKPSLNDDGFVAFLAFFDEGGEAILLGNGGALHTVATTDGPIGSFGFGGPSLNGVREVAFTASPDESFDQALFLWHDRVVHRVIGPGDALAGSVVTNVVSCREALNDQRQIAFQAQLEDGRAVIVRARPDGWARPEKTRGAGARSSTVGLSNSTERMPARSAASGVQAGQAGS